MNIEIATQADSEALVQFHREFPMKGLVEFKLDRKKDYFGPYKIQSDLYRTYVLKDSSQDIHAAASFIFRDVYQDGQKQRVAWASDLRVSNNRRAILEWSHHFLPVMKQVTQEFGISNFFSAINLTEPSGLNLFVRPRTMKRPLPRYFLYRKFKLVSLHGRFPWAPKPLPHVRIRRGNPQNLEALLVYILKRSHYRPFASIWDLPSLQAKMSRFPGLSLQDFLIAFDHNDNVIGCLAPWKPQDLQDWIPLRYSLRAHNFRQFLKFGRLLGWTRTMSKPIRSTGFETPLKFQYLTHIFVDNEDIFESLLYTAFENATSQEFLLYAHADNDIRLLPPTGWVAAEIPHALYSVTPPDEEPPSFLHPSISWNPEIEACWI